MKQQQPTTLRTAQGSFEELHNLHPEHAVWAVMGVDGDTKRIWDPTNPEEVEVAREQFRTLTVDHRYRAFKVDRRGERGDMVTNFDPEEKSYIFVPAMAGG